MGLHRTQALIAALILLAAPATAQEAGWHYSPLPGEGDRATMGCDRDATAEDFTCLVVRCEDDFTTGIHIHTSHPVALGSWEMTLDRENAIFIAGPSPAPYGGRFVERADWLLDRIRQGTFIYLRHADDSGGNVAYIELGGSLFAVNRALAFCAPRIPVEPIADGGV